MEQFKSLLKESIAQKVSCVYLKEGKEPVADTPTGSKNIGPLATKNFLEDVFGFLFATSKDALDAGAPTHGILNIAGLGNLNVLGWKHGKGWQLAICFPVTGDQKFSDLKTKWQNEYENESRFSISEEPSKISEPGKSPFPDAPPLPFKPGELVDLRSVGSKRDSAFGSFDPTGMSQVANIPGESPEGIEGDEDGEQGFGLKGFTSILNPGVNQPTAMGLSSAPSLTPGPITPTPLSQGLAAPILKPLPQAGILRPEVPAPLQAQAANTSMQFTLPPEDSSPPLKVSELKVAPLENRQPPALPNSDQLMSSTPAAVKPLVPAPPQPAVQRQSPPPAASSAAQENKPIIFDANDPDKVVVRSGDFAIDSLLRHMMAKKASDLHLTLTQPPVLRVDGEVERQEMPLLDAATMERYLLPIMPPKNREEFSSANDTDFAYELPGVGRFRVNMFRDGYGVGAVLRQIPAKILTAEQLKLPKAITDFCALTKGLVLVTGPTGSGKSTTLAAMIDKINKERHEHILTIEDPVEFVHPQQRCLVNQREVGKHTSSFKRALKAALREDPDVILIGELRDLETIAIAIETAETGHLVFGTLHTNTAISTVDRIIDQFPSNQQSQIRTMLASSLKGVVAQTLVKKIGGGRVAAHEILVVDDAVSSNIREGKNHLIQNTMITQKAAGNQLLNECLLTLAKDGLIEPMDAYLKCIDKKSLVELAKRWNIPMAFVDKEGKLLAS
ncbi:MAG: PilT/PilU family type 4a pilus ATPase [Pseudomonadota bacterium]